MTETCNKSKFISSKLMGVKMKLINKNQIFVHAYVPKNDVTEDIMESFGKNLKYFLNCLKMNEKVCLLGDLNARVGDVEVIEIVGNIGVSDKKILGLVVGIICC